MKVKITKTDLIISTILASLLISIFLIGFSYGRKIRFEELADMDCERKMIWHCIDSLNAHMDEIRQIMIDRGNMAEFVSYGENVLQYD